MARYLILVNSVTYAYKAHHILQQHWIKSAVVRTPERFAQNGCGYSLELREPPGKAVSLLEQAGIRVLRTAELEK
ncbi:MAG: DUF3343 domain-containing protein [Oscillospiraceae bacterium]|nr:DUF3343 domain-containing protein [Oscillospiraceae bacterium]